ncbi:MAG: hypothetical protein ACTSU5_05515 [Promethearchaeota archaeon]
MMESTEKKQRTKNIRKQVKKDHRKQRLQFSWYISTFVAMFFLGYLIPIALFLVYYHLVGIHTILSGNFTFQSINPFTTTFWLELKILRDPIALAFYTFPLLLVGLYLLHIVLNVYMVRAFISGANKLSPPREGVFERDFQESQKVLKIYHYRGFLMRYIKWKIMRSPFPWLVNWAFRTIGTMQIGKNVTFEDHYLAHEFFTIGDNAYIGRGTIVTTHVVEGVFGRIVIKGIKVGNNATVSSSVIIGPDCSLGENTHVLPRGALPKGYHLRANNYYWGRPVVRLSKRRFQRDFLNQKK